MEVKTIFHILPQVILSKEEGERERDKILWGNFVKVGRWNSFLEKDQIPLIRSIKIVPNKRRNIFCHSLIPFLRLSTFPSRATFLIQKIHTSFLAFSTFPRRGVTKRCWKLELQFTSSSCLTLHLWLPSLPILLNISGFLSLFPNPTFPPPSPSFSSRWILAPFYVCKKRQHSFGILQVRERMNEEKKESHSHKLQRLKNVPWKRQNVQRVNCKRKPEQWSLPYFCSSLNHHFQMLTSF